MSKTTSTKLVPTSLKGRQNCTWPNACQLPRFIFNMVADVEFEELIIENAKNCTPGTGKSTLCSEVCQQCQMEWVNIGEVAKQNQLYTGFDDQYNCPVLDEDQVLDELEDKMHQGGNVVDYHSNEFFPERWFDIVFVLTTDNTVLYDRLKNRGYAGKKLEDNVQCEIFQTVLGEARESYKSEIVHELKSNTPDDLENNIENIVRWVECWKRDRGFV